MEGHQQLASYSSPYLDALPPPGTHTSTHTFTHTEAPKSMHTRAHRHTPYPDISEADSPLGESQLSLLGGAKERTWQAQVGDEWVKAERDPESGEGESSRKRRRWTGSLKAPSRRAGPPGPPRLPAPSSAASNSRVLYGQREGECKRQGWVRATGGEQRKIRGGAQIRQGEGEACRERGGQRLPSTGLGRHIRRKQKGQHGDEGRHRATQPARVRRKQVAPVRGGRGRTETGERPAGVSSDGVGTPGQDPGRRNAQSQNRAGTPPNPD